MGHASRTRKLRRAGASTGATVDRHEIRERPPDFTAGTFPPIREIPPPADLAAGHRQVADELGTRYRMLRTFEMGGCTVILTREYGMYHLSISNVRRPPTWDEVAHAWYSIVPGAADRRGALMLPPIGEYVNLNPHCFQVVEIDEPPDHDPETHAEEATDARPDPETTDAGPAVPARA